jgi:hypothetical protein
LVAQAFEVIAGVKARDLSGRVAVAIPELDLLAVGEEDERIVAKLGLDARRRNRLLGVFPASSSRD